MEQAQEGCMLEAANLEYSSHLVNSLIMKSQIQREHGATGFDAVFFIK